MSTSTARRAAVYLRISLDHTGEGLAIDRQREDCLRIVRERGWELVAEYADHSITASDAKKTRPQYEALVMDFAAGRFDALVCYDLDRLTRQPRQLEDWIDAAEDRGLAIVTANGEADLGTDGGRMFARVKAAVARSEVERKSARQRSAARQRAALGRPPLGVRLTGYTTDGQIVEHEARAVRLMFELFGSGESLKGIVRALTVRGEVTRRGRPWNPSTVRTILLNPRYAGRAVYQGAPTGELGSWEPIVDGDTFDVVQARLTDPRRTSNRRGTDRKHLGSGLFECGVCGEKVRAWSGARYRCRNACVNRSMGPVDRYVNGVVDARLSLPDVADLVARNAEDTAPITKQIKQLRARLDSVAADYDAGRIDGIRYQNATDRVRAELEAAEHALGRATNSEALAGVLASRDPAAAYAAASLMVKRSVIGTLMTVRLHSGQRYSRTFDPESVAVHWQGDDR